LPESPVLLSRLFLATSEVFFSIVGTEVPAVARVVTVIFDSAELLDRTLPVILSDRMLRSDIGI
jgi:hypothetical protein